MDDRVRCITARRVRNIMRSAAANNVVALHPESPVPPPRRSRPSFLKVFLAIPVLALLPMNGTTPTLAKALNVALYNPNMNCGISKFRMAECDPNEYVLEVLREGRPQHTLRPGEMEELPVF